MTDEYSLALRLHQSSSGYFRGTAVCDIDARVFGDMDTAQFTVAFCHHLLRLNGLFFQAIRLSYCPIPESEWIALCLTAVNQNGKVLGCLWPEVQTPAVVLAAVRQNPRVLELIPCRSFTAESFTAEICEIMVRYDGRSLRCVPDDFRTPSLCRLAVQQNWQAVVYIPESMNQRYVDAISRVASEPE